jgi:hypothetical protein
MEARQKKVGYHEHLALKNAVSNCCWKSAPRADREEMATLQAGYPLGASIAACCKSQRQGANTANAIFVA